MKRRPHFHWRAFLYASLVLACGFSTAQAGFNISVAYNVTRQANSYLYTYTVTDAVNSTGSITEFDLTVNDPVGPTLITSPNDFFGFSSPADSLISFTAFDSGITPGTSGIFSFVSTSAPGLVADSVQGFDSSTSSFANSAGFTFGAASVPEPSSLVMLGFGTTGVLGLLIRARNRRVA